MAIQRAPKKVKWYVVWIGREPGLYPSWEKCKAQVDNFAGAKYKAFDTLAEARDAFDAGPPERAAKKKSVKDQD